MGDRTWPNLLAALLRAEELSTSDTSWAMGEIMSGSATPAQIAGFATALRAKGETPGEVAGLVEAMLAHATRVQLPEPRRAAAVDVVGTGGDRAHTVNISTMAALVVAAAGVPVVKHGNRAASSSCGAADLLEHLGIPLNLGPEGVARCVAEANIGFCFAARFHPGMRHAGATRRELGVATFFNFLGPLTNPAQPRNALVGCFDQAMAPVMAEVFARRGDSVLLVRGEDGLDEFSTTAPTRIWLSRAGTVTQTVLDAADLGLARAEPGDLRGGDASFNADVARRVFAGERGPVRDAVLVNAAAALAAQTVSTDLSGAGGQDGASGQDTVDSDAALADALRAGLDRAATAIDSAAVTQVLAHWVTVATDAYGQE